MYQGLRGGRGLGVGDEMGVFAACPDANGFIDWSVHRPPQERAGYTVYYDGAGCGYWVRPVLAGYTPEGQPIWADQDSQEAQEFQAVLDLRTDPQPVAQTAAAAPAVPTWAIYGGAAAMLFLLLRR